MESSEQVLDRMSFGAKFPGDGGSIWIQVDFETSDTWATPEQAEMILKNVTELLLMRKTLEQ